jgi:hypothetical protein
LRDFYEVLDGDDFIKQVAENVDWIDPLTGNPKKVPALDEKKKLQQ